MNNQSDGRVSGSDLFLRGDVQVLEAGIEQQVLVDPVSCDFDRLPVVHLRMSRQVDLQHLRRKRKYPKSLNSEVQDPQEGLQYHQRRACKAQSYFNQ